MIHSTTSESLATRELCKYSCVRSLCSPEIPATQPLDKKTVKNQKFYPTKIKVLRLIPQAKSWAAVQLLLRTEFSQACFSTSHFPPLIMIHIMSISRRSRSRSRNDAWLYRYTTCMGRPSHPRREGRVLEYRSPEDHNIWRRRKRYFWQRSVGLPWSFGPRRTQGHFSLKFKKVMTHLILFLIPEHVVKGKDRKYNMIISYLRGTVKNQS